MSAFKVKNQYVSVPVDFIDKYMAGAHGAYIKVYLYGLAAAAQGREADNETVAEDLGILVTDVEKAWKYWADRGLVAMDGEGITYGAAPSGAGAADEASAGDKPPQVTPADITAALNMDPNMRETLTMVEHMLGKPLTRREMTSVFNLMDWYGMDQSLVLMLFEYCISMDKRSFAYIEKVAQSWNRDGINDIKSAEAVIKRASAEKKFQGQCRRIFGLERAFTNTELKYLSSWKSEMSFSPAMVEQAFDITVKNTGKLSFAYMNKILSNWYKKGIKTPEKIQELDRKPARPAAKIDEIERIETMRRMGKTTDK